jgi:hypothetical protein
MEDASWKALLQSESAQRAALVKHGTARDAVKPLREWWGTVQEVFERVIEPSGALKEPLPAELFKVISVLAGYLAVGQILEPISGVRSRGRTSPGPKEKRHIQFAVTYCKAVEGGLIKDRNATQTIIDAYGLRGPKTVQEWRKTITPFDLAPYKVLPDALKNKMLECGQYYRNANRWTWASQEKKGPTRGS